MPLWRKKSPKAERRRGARLGAEHSRSGRGDSGSAVPAASDPWGLRLPFGVSSWEVGHLARQKSPCELGRRPALRRGVLQGTRGSRRSLSPRRAGVPAMLEPALPSKAGAWVSSSVGTLDWDGGTGDHGRARSRPISAGGPGTASTHPVGETQVHPRGRGVLPQPAPSPGGVSLGKGREDSSIAWRRRRAAWPSCCRATCAVPLTQLPRIVSPSGSSCPGTRGPPRPLLRLQKVNSNINST